MPCASANSSCVKILHARKKRVKLVFTLIFWFPACGIDMSKYTADKICAYVKCLEEIAAGNGEFVKAEKSLRTAVDALELPEVRYFMKEFAPSFRLPLDDLG